MQGYASVTVAGNLTRDPETKTFDSGSSITEFGIAVNRQRKQGDEYVDEVSFFDVAVWGGFGELCARKLRKGDAVSLLGRLEQQTWEKDGEKRSKVRIVANQVVGEGFFRPADENNTGTAAPAAEAAPAADAQAQQTVPPAADDDIPF